jgi:hypothetical protein
MLMKPIYSGKFFRGIKKSQLYELILDYAAEHVKKVDGEITDDNMLAELWKRMAALKAKKD